jgi:uncharacterized protein YfaP (DUF2135 family)
MIDDFDLLPKQEPFDPFSVVLFKALQVVAFLFLVTLLVVQPKSKEGKVDSKAEFLVTMDWPDNHPDDIDLFVMDPIGNVAWYRHKEAGFMVLDRDDRGGANDFVVVKERQMPAAVRQEICSIRGIIAGEYTVNVYHFTATTGQPVPVTVTVQKLNPSVSIVGKETVMLDHGGQEKTALRFTLNEAGEVTATDLTERSILETMYVPHHL